MKIVSWNIACIPSRFNLFGDPSERIDKIIDVLVAENADILCLQEVFSKNIKTILTAAFKEKGYHIQQSASNTLLMNGGLFFASKHEIAHYEEHIFPNSCGDDSLARKGYQYAVVNYNQQFISIINTHMNADTAFSLTKQPSYIRIQQIDTIFKTIDQQPCVYNFLCGDLNSDFNSYPILHIKQKLSRKYNYHINKKKFKHTKHNNSTTSSYIVPEILKKYPYIREQLHPLNPIII